MTDPTTRTDDTLGGLVHQLSEQIPELVRSEIRLARADLVAQATPPAPERAIAGHREDVATLKGGHA